MRVELIDYTGSGWQNDNPMYAAMLLVYAKNTRLMQSAETRMRLARLTQLELMQELEAVANSVRSSWEFISYSFQISGVTRAFTHQLVRTRYGVSFAQQAQRVVDMSAFETRMPASVKVAAMDGVWGNLMDHIRKVYVDFVNSGIPAQDARGVLPTNVQTNILARFDLRALADMLGKRDNLRAQDEYAEVARAMKAEVLKVHPWAKIFLEPERKQTPALDAILTTALGSSSPVDKPLVNDALKELDRLKGTWG